MERTYTIPLRREWIKTVRYKRAKKTIRAIREFMEQHMKAEDVKIGPFLNEEVWKHGIANPPSRVRVNCIKDKDGVVTVELFGKPLGKVEPAKPKDTKVEKSPKKTAKDESKKESEKAAPKDEKPDARPAKEKPKGEAKVSDSAKDSKANEK